MSATATTNFDAFMDAVTKAYGKDVWNGITSGRTFYSDEFSQLITQVDGVDAVYLKNGNVAYYTYNGNIVGTAGSVESAIDSNIGVSRITTEVRQPAELAVNGTTGEVTATAGMTKVSTGAKVATTVGKVATGVAAVATGVQLGAIIDEALYNANPEFWDSHNMSTLNPQTWDSICTTQAGKDVFNFVFGIDKDTKETTAYMDENAFAYIAQYMSNMGAFSSGINYPDFSKTGTVVITSRVSPYDLLNTLANAPRHIDFSGIQSDIDSFISQNWNDNKICQLMYTTSQNSTYGASPLSIYISNDEFLTDIKLGSDTRCKVLMTFGSGSAGEPIKILRVDSIVNAYMDKYVGVDTSYSNQLRVSNINATASSGVEGIDTQEDSTLPTGITPAMTIPEVLAYLKNTYPDLWDDAITNDVIQPDGSVKTYTYIPTGLPDSIPVDEITGELQPIGGVDMIQGQLPISQTSPETLQGTLLDVATTQSAYNPQPEIEETNTPATGEGITPPVVLPTGSAQALYAVYNPSQSEVNDFGAWLWDSNFFEQLKKLFNDPMQSIIGLHKIFATPATSGRGNIYVGYLDSGVAANLVSNQYTEVDCGTVALYEYFGNALDYQATDVYLYLPFVGIVPLNVDDVTRAEINVKYKVDVLTGACLASVYVTRDAAGGQLYTYAGNCGVQYPLSSGSYMGIVASIAGIVGGVVGTIATGGAMLPVALGAGASALGSARTKVEHSGSLSGNAGAMGIKKPYLIIRRPQTAIADDYFTFDGGSENEKVVLGTHSGFTRVKYINLEGVSNATRSELAEIETLLKDGVII